MPYYLISLYDVISFGTEDASVKAFRIVITLKNNKINVSHVDGLNRKPIIIYNTSTTTAINITTIVSHRSERPCPGN